MRVFGSGESFSRFDFDQEAFVVVPQKQTQNLPRTQHRFFLSLKSTSTLLSITPPVWKMFFPTQLSVERRCASMSVSRVSFRRGGGGGGLGVCCSRVEKPTAVVRKDPCTDVGPVLPSLEVEIEHMKRFYFMTALLLALMMFFNNRN